ncbi:MAG: ABC transporter permease [Ancalomicrobiaceae bacterium]|nr:ABC transporter permease [Ancalomicrobiaceae bacterium]
MSNPLDWFGRREALLAVACLAAVLLFSFLSPYFFNAENLSAVLSNSVELLLVGLGMTLLLGVGGIDVSVGVAMGLAAIAVGRLLQAGVTPAVAGLAGPVAGLLIGVGTGSVVVFGRIPAIVATLGLYGVYRAGIYLCLGGDWLSGLPIGLTELVGTGIAGVPLAFPIVALTYLALYVALRRTPFGPHLLAIGDSEAKARLSGVSVNRTQLLAFIISGGLTGLAASFYVATYRNVEMTIGGTLALEAIAAVVLGGTSVIGGRVSLIGTVLGVLLLRLLQNGLLLSGVPSLWQTVVTGLLLLFVLGIEAVQGRLSLTMLMRSKSGRLASRVAQ